MSPSAAIDAFPIHVDQSVLDDLKTRLAMTRWVEKETPDDWSQGIPLSYMREIHESWLHDYDWRVTEAAINELGSYKTHIDGVDIHFLHIPSPHAEARPLILTHGWPGSILEFRKIIAPLTDPTRHGGRAEDAFHLVIPAIPGFGFSQKPEKPGWTVERIAQAWAVLMSRLGYERYYAQGGDWGSAITVALGRLDAAHCVGVHVNFVIVMPPAEVMENPTPEEAAALVAFGEHDQWGTGYSKQQSTRPQTLAYGLVDSPIGQAAWILEKFHAWSDCRGHPENSFTRTELLDNVMMYWLTASAGSSARLYWESFNSIVPDPYDAPFGASLFAIEIIRPSRRWAESQYKNITFWNEHSCGGHFAAMEQPDLFVADVRQCFAQMDGA